jgi:hypothetical protein
MNLRQYLIPIKIEIISNEILNWVETKPKIVKNDQEDKFYCRNLNLRLVTKARACEGAGQVSRPRVTFHAPESVGECEIMNPHTPK